MNGSRCDRIRRGEGASKRDSKGQKRDEERRRERAKQGTEGMVGTEEKEEGARKNGKMREERKDVGNGSRILTNWKWPLSQRRRGGPGVPRWFRKGKRASMLEERRDRERDERARHF